MSDAAEECEISRDVAIDACQWLREICGWRLLNHDDLTLSGMGPVHPIVV